MSWSLSERGEALRAAARDGVDLLVVGGGITGAGVLRDAASLEATMGTIDEIAAAARRSGETSPDMAELRNLLDVGAALVNAARARTESRGNHWRADFPDADPELRVRLVQT